MATITSRSPNALGRPSTLEGLLELENLPRGPRAVEELGRILLETMDRDIRGTFVDDVFEAADTTDPAYRHAMLCIGAVHHAMIYRRVITDDQWAEATRAGQALPDIPPSMPMPPSQRQPG